MEVLNNVSICQTNHITFGILHSTDDKIYQLLIQSQCYASFNYVTAADNS